MKGPIRAYLYDSEIHRSGERLNSADFANLAVEAEMALRLEDDGRVVAAFPVIELHHFVFRAVHKTLAELVANNGLNAGIVLPDQAWISSDYPERPSTLSLQINGRVIDSGNLWPLPGRLPHSIG
jgi:2-keto-4-pentenoate hydratase